MIDADDLGPVAEVKVATVQVRQYIPKPVVFIFALTMFAVLVAMFGLITYGRQSHDETVHARLQVTQLQSQVNTLQAQQVCRATFANDVNLKLADQVTAIGSSLGVVSDFLNLAIERNAALVPTLKAELAQSRVVLNNAGGALRKAIEKQRQAIAAC